jgi:multiple sugar transport system ATP-binding protein
MARVRFEHVTKQYGSVVAVQDLSLTIEACEFLVFVGPSGCGKTTCLRLLAGLEEISQGSIYIGDRRINSIPAKDRDIAMVFQSYALYPHMSVYDNIAFGLKMRRIPKAEIDNRVRTTAKRLGLEDVLTRKPKQLSGGQRQRVALGRAIVRNPAVFLMDEPLSNLDAKLRVQARAEIGKLHKQLGATVVYVTHDQVEAMTMGSRIAVMNQGILQQIDTPQTLYHQPVNLFVADFIGSPAMNFFAARLIQTDADLYLDAESFRFPLPRERSLVYRPYLNKPVILGIRPEHIYDPQFVPAGISSSRVQATVTVTELMGHEVIVYLNTLDREGALEKQDFVARVDPRTRLQVGERVSLALDLEKFHLFDPDSGQRISER